MTTKKPGRPRIYDKAKTEKLHIRVSKEEKEILLNKFGRYKMSINLRKMIEPIFDQLRK